MIHINFDRAIMLASFTFIASILILLSITFKPTNIQVKTTINLQLKTELPKPMAWPKLDLDPDKSTLVYIHIPKTAGSTFRHMLGAVTKQIDLRRIDYRVVF